MRERALDSLDIGYAPGAWDMFHAGHLAFLRRAKRMCDSLAVGVVTDEVLMQAKGKRPMFPLEERVAVVEALDLADQVVVDPSRDKRVVWQDVRFTRLFKGDDWLDTPQGNRLEDSMSELGVNVHYLPYTESTSSTKLRAQVTQLSAVQPQFAILAVCCDNRFRSPIMQALLQDRIDTAQLNWSVTSAGVKAIDGQTLSPAAANTLGGLGLALPSFETRRLTDDLVKASDLILTATDRQRSAVARMHPRAVGYTFTLRQFSHLVSQTDFDLNQLEDGLLRRAARGRTLVQPLREGRDITAPSLNDDHDRCVEEIEDALQPILPRHVKV